MNRHPVLQQFSKDHHYALLLAQVLKGDGFVYQGYPSDDENKIKYFNEFFDKELDDHFRKEEEVLFPSIQGISDDFDYLIEILLDEHEILRRMRKDSEKIRQNRKRIKILGELLESHARKEERELFELIQAVLTELQMKDLGKALGVW